MILGKNPRLAIFGSRNSVEVALLPCLRRIRWLPRVVIDTSLSRGVGVAQKFGVSVDRVANLSDWRLLTDEFDAAIVALPLGSYNQIAIDLLDAGKHVYLERPVTHSLTGYLRMRQVAARRDVTLTAGFPRRRLRVFHWTAALVKSGGLGQIKHVKVREGIVTKADALAGFAYQPDPDAGGGMWSVGIDTLDQMRGWFGNLELVNYLDDSKGGVESERFLECKILSGGLAGIEFSRTRRLPNSIRIEGTTGFVEVHLFKNEVLAGSSDALAFCDGGLSASRLRSQFAHELLDDELKGFRAASEGYDQEVTNASEDLTNLVELIEKCYASRAPLGYPWSDRTLPPPSEANAASLSTLEHRKVLVTGATGFIGGRLVERLIQEHNAEVRCIVRDPERTVRLARLSVELIHADLSNASEISRALQGVDFVFHCAHDTQSRRQNSEGLRNILDACTAHQVQRLVHVSTFAVYEPFPDGSLSERTRDGDRSNGYVDIKLELEKMAFDAVQSGGVATTIIQPAIVYGPFCWPWTNIPAEKLMFGEVVLPDCGEGLCNAVYIDDLVDSMLLSAVSPGAVGERFIISGPDPVTWATFYSEIADALGAKRPLFWPTKRIVEANGKVARNLGIRALNPKRVARAVIQRRSLRQVLEFALAQLPIRLRRLLIKKIGPGSYRTRELFIPDLRELGFYSSRPIVTCEKARTILNYKPRYNFDRGMSVTAPYLRWAYGENV